MRDDGPADIDESGVRRVGGTRTTPFVRPSFARRIALRVAYRREQFGAGFALLLREEQERGGAFLWAPVFFAAGILLYFTLPREPLAFAFPTLAVLGILAAWRSRRAGLWYRCTVLVALVAGGAAVAQGHVWWQSTLTLPTGTVATVDARIERIEERANGSARYTLALDKGQTSLVGRGIETVPNLIRLTARKAMPQARIGDRLTGRARVGPPPAPVMPGGYDFAFHAWFDGLGGSGFFLGAPQLVSVATTGLSIESVRNAIARTIRASMPGDAGGIAVALIVGDRSGIPEEISEALRRRRLAHILAISGLHMTLVAGTVLLGARLAFAAIPGLALQYPVKKWAACAALVAATLYLSISGGGVSARRAYIMIAIMLLAVLADRRALTMRNVAIAAFAVLLLSPHAILSPGFQMSFAAVAALIAMFEIARERRALSTAKINDRMPHWLRAIGRNMAGLAATSIIAGLATGIFAAYHFYRVAPLGLPANLMAMPVVSFVVMPMALVSMLAMPFGLESYPLQVMGWGSSAVVEVATRISALGPEGSTGRIAPATLALMTIALLVSTLSRTRLRMLAVVPMVMAVVLPIGVNRPDVLISGTGRQVGIIGEGGVLRLARPRAERFATGIWKAAYGDAPADDGKFECDPHGCTISITGRIVLVVEQGDRLWEDCRMADIIVLPFASPDTCGTVAANKRPLVIDMTKLEKHGAHALHFTEQGGTSIEVARPLLSRPWTKAFAR